MKTRPAAAGTSGVAVRKSVQEPHRSAFAAAVARVLAWGRRRSPLVEPRLDDTACSVFTHYGPFRIRSYHVAVRVREAFGGFLYEPRDAPLKPFAQEARR